MARAFKGITTPAARATLGALGMRAARHARSDDERRNRMRELDDATPLKPSPTDIIAGPAAVAELARIERKKREAA